MEPQPHSVVPRLVTVLAVLAFLGAGVLVIGSSVGEADTHTLRATFGSAIQLTDGQEVRMGGRKVGEVGDIELKDGQPVVELRITDDQVWPLPEGTRPRARFGSTTSYLLRYVELLPGPEGADPLPDNGLLARGETLTPVELDEAYRIFRGRTDKDVRRLVSDLGETLDGRGPALRQGLAATPGGLDETGALTREFADNELALRTLVHSGDRTLGALAARDAELGELVTNAAGTFDELAAHATDQQRSLERAPETFDESRTTLARLDRSLIGLNALFGDLRPGAPALRRLATAARPTLAELRRVTPQATAALRAGTAASPSLNRLLATGTDFLPRTGKVLERLNPMLSCVRPYGPEIAGFLSTWTGFAQSYDAMGHYARSFPLSVNPAFLPGTSNTSRQVTQATAVKYAMPRPPGLNAGKPWFQPQCGAGPESLDPSKDPERPETRRP